MTDSDPRTARARHLAHAVLDDLDASLDLALRATDLAHPELDSGAADIQGANLPLSSYLAHELADRIARLRATLRAYRQFRQPRD